ncbi:AI-2E family transporter [Bacillus sp. FJAT-45350]|uniref:AI-2E family transporter n=1 Tax=Bacillus sp. FJAT-45350 TaxID=2011014 RepID=UPI000BB8E762|nr:AI-2E family transporter [Bacillus sp. FJAT-45350]
MEKTSSMQWLIKITNFLLILLCVYVFMKLAPMWKPVLDVITSVAIPFLFAALITYLLHPVIEWTHDSGLPRPVAVLIIYFLFFGGLTYLGFKGAPYVVEQIKELVENIPQYVEEVQRWLTLFNEHVANMPVGIQNQIDEWLLGLEEVVEDIFERIIAMIMGIFSSFIYFIIVPFLVFYLLKDYQLVEKVAWYLTPKRWRRRGIRFIRDVDQSFGNYIRGQILVSMSVGVIATTGLYLIGLPYAVLLGLFIGMTDIIPYFGAFLGAVPALIVAALQSWQMLIYTGLVILILQQIEGNILSPVIVGRTLHTHPVIIMLALILGIEIGGIIGLVLAVPILSIVKVIVLHIRANSNKD